MPFYHDYVGDKAILTIHHTPSTMKLATRFMKKMYKKTHLSQKQITAMYTSIGRCAQISPVERANISGRKIQPHQLESIFSGLRENPTFKQAIEDASGHRFVLLLLEYEYNNNNDAHFVGMRQDAIRHPAGTHPAEYRDEYKNDPMVQAFIRSCPRMSAEEWDHKHKEMQATNPDMTRDLLQYLTRQQKEKCLQCKKTHTASGSKLHKCERCLFARYCSKSCQRIDWPVHKEMCTGYKFLVSMLVPDQVRG
jgi:hypothetical protein